MNSNHPRPLKHVVARGFWIAGLSFAWQVNAATLEPAQVQQITANVSSATTSNGGTFLALQSSHPTTAENIDGTWFGQEGDTLVMSNHRYQVTEDGEILDTGVFEIQGNQLVTQSQLTGLVMSYRLQVQGNLLRLYEPGSGATYQYRRQSSETDTRQHQPPSQPSGPAREESAQNHLLQGRLCSYSGSSGSYSGTSSSSSTRVFFDGNGGFQYGSESSMSSSAGGYYSETPYAQGRYQVQGNTVLLQFADGSSGSAAIYERRHGQISALTYEGTIYAQQLCD